MPVAGDATSNRRAFEAAEAVFDGRGEVEQAVFAMPGADDLDTDGQTGGVLSGLHGECGGV